jgi:hypothetical protein
MPFVLYEEESGEFYGGNGTFGKARIYVSRAGATRESENMNKLNIYWYKKGISNTYIHYVVIEVSVKIKRKEDLNKIRVSRI